MSPSAVAAPTTLSRAGGSGSWLRALRRQVSSLAIYLTCALGSIMALGAAATRYGEEPATGAVASVQDLLIVVGVAGAVLAVAVLRIRHTSPYAATLVTASLPLVLPLDATAALFALAALIRSRTGRRVWASAALVALATVVALFRDASGATTASSVLKSLTTPHEPGATLETELSIWVPIIVAVTLIGAAVGVGLFQRSRLDLAATKDVAAAAQQNSTELTDQLGRQAERELIAREVHDVIGHRLSLLSLHAGGLEVAAGQDERLAHSAALVRQGAQQAMDDLRSLLNVMREPEVTAFNRTAVPSLTDLTSVIDETVAGGMGVVSTIFLSDADKADPALARAVYRIVQELLTNARRHAPGAPVRLVVQGGPQEGLMIETANRLTTHQPGPPGNGLTGITERVGMWQGTIRHGLDEAETFRVSVRLPWVEAAEESKR